MPGSYIDHANNMNMVKNVLFTLGLCERWPKISDFFFRIPDSRKVYYLGSFPGGNLGPDLGFTLNTHKENSDLLYNDLKCDDINRIFTHLKEVHLADERCRLLPECTLSKISYIFSEKKLLKLGLINRPAFVKIKWHRAVPMAAKFYFESTAVML